MLLISNIPAVPVPAVFGAASCLMLLQSALPAMPAKARTASAKNAQQELTLQKEAQLPSQFAQSAQKAAMLVTMAQTVCVPPGTTGQLHQISR